MQADLPPAPSASQDNRFRALRVRRSTRRPSVAFRARDGLLDPEMGVTPAGDQSPFTFGEKILNLLDQGRFTSTYKYAVLLALVDLCLENPKPDGSAPGFAYDRSTR